MADLTDSLSQHVTGRQGERLSFADFQARVLTEDLSPSGLEYLICKVDVPNDVARNWLREQGVIDS